MILTEIWDNIPDYCNYQVSNAGRIKHKPTILKRIIKGKQVNYSKKETILTPSTNAHRLKHVTLYNERGSKRLSIHNIVGKIFVPNPLGYDTLLHKDGDSNNNRADNLEWVGDLLQLPSEIWKPVVGYEGLYEVSDLGRIKSLSYDKTGLPKIMKPRINQNGYLVLMLWKDSTRKAHSLHRVVASSFIANPNNLPVVNHIDFDTTNCKASNLEWCTQIENIKHSVVNGRIGRKGELSPSSKLNSEKAKEIIELIREDDLTMDQIALKYNISTTMVSAINQGKKWNYYGLTYPIRYYRETILTKSIKNV